MNAMANWWSLVRLWWVVSAAPWCKQVLVAVDQVANAASGGWADETISSRAWRLHTTRARWARARAAIDALFRLLGQHDHCQRSYESERQRLQLPPEMRG